MVQGSFSNDSAIGRRSVLQAGGDGCFVVFCSTGSCSLEDVQPPEDTSAGFQPQQQADEGVSPQVFSMLVLQSYTSVAMLFFFLVSFVSYS